MESSVEEAEAPIVIEARELEREMTIGKLKTDHSGQTVVNDGVSGDLKTKDSCLLRGEGEPKEESMAATAATGLKGSEYDYLHRGLYTTEHFKIELRNLPNHFGIAQVKKKLISLGLRPRKIKATDKSRFAFITFSCESDRADGLSKLSGLEWKGCTLEAKRASPAADPIHRKRACPLGEGGGKVTKLHESPMLDYHSSVLSVVSPAQQLLNSVTSLWRMSYQEQLKLKQKKMGSFLKKLGLEVERLFKSANIPKVRYPTSKFFYGKFLEDIKPSPIVNGYRNKCEFTIGYSPRSTGSALHDADKEKSLLSATDKSAPVPPSQETGDLQALPISDQSEGPRQSALPVSDQPEGQRQSGAVTVGFRLSDYKSGCCEVYTPIGCFNVSDTMKAVVQDFEKLVRSSMWSPFDPISQEGHWQHLLVRTGHGGNVMLKVTFVKDKISEEAAGEVRQLLADYGSRVGGTGGGGGGANYNLSSIYLTLTSLRFSGNDQLELIYGQEMIEEILLGMSFRITPQTFLQVNTQAAEILYKLVSDWCSLSPETTLLDVCCGTGTIGLTVAKEVKKVVGIEMVPDAIDDARLNAATNGVTNIEFHCGKAEEVLPSLLSIGGGGSANFIQGEIIAVLDPPRAGLHTKVIQAVRKENRLQRVVYVSCSPNSAMSNLQDLLRPESKRMRGKPFDIVKVGAVDLFPHTEHCELVLVLERRHSPTNVANLD